MFYHKIQLWIQIKRPQDLKTGMKTGSSQSQGWGWWGWELMLTCVWEEAYPQPPPLCLDSQRALASKKEALQIPYRKQIANRK